MLDKLHREQQLKQQAEATKINVAIVVDVVIVYDDVLIFILH